MRSAAVISTKYEIMIIYQLRVKNLFKNKIDKWTLLILKYYGIVPL